jgi:hypothetical protein
MAQSPLFISHLNNLAYLGFVVFCTQYSRFGITNMKNIKNVDKALNFNH